MKYNFINLLDEAVIKTNVRFVSKTLENAKKKINKLRDKSAYHVENVLNTEFAKYKTDSFDKIEWVQSKQGRNPSARQEAVHIVQGLSTNAGIITLHYDKDLPEVFEKNFPHWNVFKAVTMEILAHEIVHVGQFDRMFEKYQKDPLAYVQLMLNLNQDDVSDHIDYLSLPLEMMAFARHAVEEFRSHGFSDKKIIRYIKEFPKAHINDSYIFYAYVKFFKKTNKKVLRKFLQYIYDYVKTDKE